MSSSPSSSPRTTSSLAAALRSALHIDRSKVGLDVGLRAALGVGLTLVVGYASGHTLAGVTASIGALSGGFASHQGTYRSRAAVVMVATLAMAGAAFVGATVGHLLGADIVIAGFLGFCAGMLVALGAPAMVIGIQAVVGLVVFSQFQFHPAQAASSAGFIVLGGALQAVLVALLWPLRRFPAERRTLGDAYAQLAGYARQAESDPSALPAPDALAPLEALMRDPQPFGGDVLAAHQALAGQADRIRLELVAVLRARERLEAYGGDREAEALSRVFRVTAATLAALSEAIRGGERPPDWDPDANGFSDAVRALRGPTAPSGAPPEPGTWLAAAVAAAKKRTEALAGEVRAATRIAALLGPGRPDRDALHQAGIGAGTEARHPSSREWVSERLEILRSNLDTSSQALRHATRLSVTLAAAVALSHAFSMAHFYWLPMTTVVVLRPDFASTFTRGVARVIGTLIGAGLVTVIVALTHPSEGWLIAIVICLCFAATSLILANYAIFSVFVASLVVTLLAFSGQPEVAAAGDRSFYTVVGAALALIAYALWPTWAASSLRGALADLVEAEARYGGLVLAAWIYPDQSGPGRLSDARLKARLARTNAEAMVTRWLSEPEFRLAPNYHSGHAPDPGLRPEAVLGFMAAMRSCVRALLSLQVGSPGRPPGHPELISLAAQLQGAFDAMTRRLRGEPGPHELADLRSTQLELDPGAGPEALVLAAETDQLVNAVNTMGHWIGLEPAYEEPGPVG